MDIRDIQNELDRLNVHPVNLGALSVDAGQVVLRGSLLTPWNVPAVVDGTWFLNVLNQLPDAAGGRATMESFCEAHAEKTKNAE